MNNGLSTLPVISRHDHLAVKTGLLISKDHFHDGNILLPGTLLGKMAGGSYRPYAESSTTAATSDASPNVALDPAAKNFKNFKIGDTIQGVGAEALGVILAINYVTGAVVLTGNAGTDAYEGAVRVAPAEISVSKADARILAEHAEYDERIGLDVSATGYIEGFLLKDNTTLTPTVISALAIRELSDTEVRLI